MAEIRENLLTVLLIQSAPSASIMSEEEMKLWNRFLNCLPT